MSRYYRYKKGSVLVMAITAIAAVGLITYSLLEWSNNNTKLNKKLETSIISRYNLSSIVEYGMSQVVQRMKIKSNIARNEFLTYPLKTPDISFLNDNSSIQITDIQLLAGPIPDKVSRYIDPTVLANKNDPDKGMTILQRDIILLSKIKQVDNHANESEFCNLAVLEVRENPALAYSLFSHNDIIFLRPAKPMVVTGTVHTNGNLIFVSEGQIYCNGLVKCVGNLQTLNPYGDVFLRSGGTDTSPTYTVLNNYMGSNWKDYALGQWNGFVQTQDMGVGIIQPFGFEVTPGSTDTNPYHKIIEPPVLVGTPGVNKDREVEKFAAKAGLVIHVQVEKKSVSTTGILLTVPYPAFTLDNGQVRISNWSVYDTHAPLPDKQTFINLGPNGYSCPPLKDADFGFALFFWVKNAMGEPNKTTISVYKYEKDSSGSYYRRDENGQIATYKRVSVPINDFYNPTFPADPTAIIRSQMGCFHTIYGAKKLLDFAFPFFANANPEAEFIFDAQSLDEGRQMCVREYVKRGVRYAGCMDVLFYRGMSGVYVRAVAPFMAPPVEPNVDTNAPIKLWDARRRKWIHMIDLDIGLLKQALDSGKIDSWNGIVYVEYEDTDSTAVRLVNAQKLPSKGSEGFTIATNNALYVQGHYNADGNLAVGNSTQVKQDEVPAAIAADAITVLSNKWDDRLSRADVTRFATVPNQNDRNIPEDTEIAAAIITGTDVYNSGGINNLVRFLEMWENKTVRIRGSLVALFQNEVAWEPLAMNYVFYPPVRDYGFSDLFKNNKFPPGTPTVRSFYKKAYKPISVNEYNELAAQVNAALSNPNLSSTVFNQAIKNIENKYNVVPVPVSSPSVPSPAPTPNPVPVPIPTPSPTPVPIPTPSPTPVPSSPSISSPTPVSVPVPTPSPAPTPNPVPVPSPVSSPSPVPVVPSPTPTPSVVAPKPAPSPTPSVPVPSPVFSPSPVPVVPSPTPKPSVVAPKPAPSSPFFSPFAPTPRTPVP